MPSRDDRQSDDNDRLFGRDALRQLSRYLGREITREQLLANLRKLADRHGVADRIDWEEITRTPRGFN